MGNHSATDRFDSGGFFSSYVFPLLWIFRLPSSWFPCGHSEAMADCWGDDFKIYALEVLFGRACVYQLRGYCIERACELWSPLAPWFLVLCLLLWTCYGIALQSMYCIFPLFFYFCFSIAEFVVSLWTWGGGGRLLRWFLKRICVGVLTWASVWFLA